MILTTFSPQDLKAYAETAIEPSIRTVLTEFDFSGLKTSGNDWTAWFENRPVASGGFIEHYPSRATAWLIMLPMPGNAVVGLTKVVRQKLRDSSYRRVEAQVECTLVRAHRWMTLLGFKLETPYKPYWLPNGGAISEYVYLRKA